MRLKRMLRVPWVSSEVREAADAAIDAADNSGTLHGLSLRLMSAGGDELERIADGLDAHGQRVEAARARADARMHQIEEATE